MRRTKAKDLGQTSLNELMQEIEHKPDDALVRTRLAAFLLRAGYLDDAQEQIDLCLAMCPMPGRKRLLVVVLRERIRFAARRQKLLKRDRLL